jgi:DNA-binding IclR family transcriptional regulator
VDDDQIDRVIDLGVRARAVFAWTGGERRLGTHALLLLIALNQHPGMTPPELARRCQLPANRTSEVLARLREAGLIEHRPVKRRVAGEEFLTDSGLETVAEFLAHAAPLVSKDGQR